MPRYYNLGGGRLATQPTTSDLFVNQFLSSMQSEMDRRRQEQDMVKKALLQMKLNQAAQQGRNQEWTSRNIATGNLQPVQNVMRGQLVEGQFPEARQAYPIGTLEREGQQFFNPADLKSALEAYGKQETEIKERKLYGGKTKEEFDEQKQLSILSKKILSEERSRNYDTVRKQASEYLLKGNDLSEVQRYLNQAVMSKVLKSQKEADDIFKAVKDNYIFNEIAKMKADGINKKEIYRELMSLGLKPEDYGISL